MFKSQNLFFCLFTGLALLCSALPASSARGADVTFYRIGFLPGDTYSRVNAVTDDGTLAACASYHYEGSTKVYSFAARWTPSGGLEPLPRLPNTANADTIPFSQGARDVTADGSRIAFIAPTLDQTGVAAGIADADGGNLIALTSLPNGDLMPWVNQLSDDGQTAFGYRLVDLYEKGAFWTATDGIQALAVPVGYTNVAPSGKAISADGQVSAGNLLKVDQRNFVVTAEQAYRWTSTTGIVGLGFLPGEEDSSTVAMSPSGSLIFGTSGASFFLWQEGKGMSEIAPPQPPTKFHGFSGGGLSADGTVAVVTYIIYSGDSDAPDVSYVLQTDTGSYIDLEDAFLQAQAGTAVEGWKGFRCIGISDDGNTVYGEAVSPENRLEGFIARFSPDFLRNLEVPLPVFTSPLFAEASYQQSFSYLLTADGMATDFTATGLPPGLEFILVNGGSAGPVSGLIQGEPTLTGIFPVTVTATNSGGTTTAVLQITVSPSSMVPRLLNISTRGDVLTGENVLIGGFIIPEGNPKKVIIRAIGPSLEGVSTPLSDPVLSLYRPDGMVETNNDWQDSQKVEIEATGIAPTDAREAAIVTTLEPGSYTAIVSGQNAGTGVGLFEAYDLDEAAGSRLANISTRGLVENSENVLIGGVIANDYLTYIVIRAIGPSLPGSVGNPLLDPVLETYNANGVLTNSNDDWQDTPLADQIQAYGLAPTDPREAAIFTSLSTDPITALVRGKDGTSGVALVEIYNVDYDQ